MPIGRHLCFVFIVAFFLFWILAIKPPVLDTGDGRVRQHRRKQLSHQARRWISATNTSSSRQGPRQTAKEEATPFTPEVEATQSMADCPADRRPYHVLLTASTGPYQLWQTRIFYYHYVRLRATLGPCTEMGGFTRLLTKPKSAPLDSLMSVMRTVVVDELTEAETHGFVVLNRPHSVLVALNRGDLNFPEKYLFIAETDHLLMKYLPNLATEELAVAYPFHYMNPKRDSKTRTLVRRFAGSDLVAEKVQQVGPSPILIHMDALKRLVKPWYDLSFALKVDPAADAEFGWMLEMWGYSIGAAVGGVAHKLMDTLQLEPLPMRPASIRTTSCTTPSATSTRSRACRWSTRDRGNTASTSVTTKLGCRASCSGRRAARSSRHTPCGRCCMRPWPPTTVASTARAARGAGMGGSTACPAA